jgi:hypothetical protein
MKNTPLVIHLRILICSFTALTLPEEIREQKPSLIVLCKIISSIVAKHNLIKNSFFFVCVAVEKSPGLY